jgi:hypothetical protein
MMPSTARAVITSLQVISTSSGCIVFLPLVLCHPDPCSWPRRFNTQPAVSPRRTPRSAAHRWVSRLWRIHRCSVGAWCLPPEAVHATCPRQHTNPLAPNVWLQQGGRGPGRRAKVPMPKVG